ncbi:MAG: RNA polymerase sigma factor [Aureliella sp.]
MNPELKTQTEIQPQPKPESAVADSIPKADRHSIGTHSELEDDSGTKPTQDLPLDTTVAETSEKTRSKLSLMRADDAHVDGETRENQGSFSQANASANQGCQTWGCELDESIIDVWIQQFSGDVYRYIFWLSGNSNTAEDITQETFLRSVKALRSGSGPMDPSKAKPWLLAVARNEFLRAIQKRRVPESNGLEYAADKPAPAETVGLDDAEWLHAGLAKLRHDFRIVVVMHYFEQASYAQIAETLDVPIGTVMSRLNRARIQLRSLLNELT